MLCSYCQGACKVLWRRWLSTQPIESQVIMCQTSKWHTDPLKHLRDSL